MNANHDLYPTIMASWCLLQIMDKQYYSIIVQTLILGSNIFPVHLQPHSVDYRGPVQMAERGKNLH